VSLRARLLAASAPLTAAVALLGWFAVSTVSDLGRTSERILWENFRSVQAIQGMREALERLDSAALLAGAGRAEGKRVETAPHVARFERELEVEEGNITEPGEAELAHALREEWSAYREAYQGCMGRRRAEEVSACYVADLEPRYLRLVDVSDRLLTLNQDAMAAKSDRSRREADRAVTTAVAAALAALVLGVAASAWLARRTIRPLAVLTQAVEAFGRGDLAARARVAGGDEVAQLASAFNAMADRIEEYRASTIGELVQAQQAAQATMDSLPDPVLVFAPDGQVLTSNRAAEALFGAREAEPLELGKLDPPLRDAIEAVRSHVLQGKGSWAPRRFDETVTVPRPDGERAFLLRGEPVYEPGGGVVAAAVVLQDVTRLRRFDEMRSDLVSTVAHQFRTPLTSLRMAVHLCLDGVAGPLSEKQTDLLQAAREESERLQVMVDELLDLARLQGGKVELEREPIGADRLLREAHRAMRPPAEERGVSLELDAMLPGDAVDADPERVQLVFSNLLENAIRHSPPGGHVRLRALPAPGVMRFEVSDEGPGVPPEHRARIFERFVRLPGAPPGGAGIGLSIASDVVRAHGGEIGVEGDSGEGATFWFTLPRASAVLGEPQTA
jgi:PAS domain S-box-containing protein